MRKLILSLILGAASFAPAIAQTTREVAYQLAELAVDESYKNVKPLMDGAFDNLLKEAIAKGHSDRSLEIFVEEVKNAFNRENFIKVVADVWAREMTKYELQQAINFIQSPAGRKFSAVSQSMKETKNLLPIFQDACGRARARVMNVGATSANLDNICNQFR